MTNDTPNEINDWKAMKKLMVPLLALAAFNPVNAAAQGLFKCVQDGKTAYQAEPCPANAKEDRLKSRYIVPSPSSSTSNSSAQATGASPEVNRMIEFMSTYQACASAIQIWGQEMAGPYQEWRLRNAAAVSQIEKDLRLRTLYQQRIEAKRNGKAGMCRDVALELRGKK